MIRDMTRYGIPSFFVNAASLILNQAPLTFIGHYRTMNESGYFAVPTRLLQTAVDAVSRVGIVTRSNVAEREASGRQASVLHLGIYSNRYCFVLFVPLTLFLLVYGREFIYVWTTKLEYANYSYPVVRILVPAIAIVMAGQYNSSAILFGLGAHKRYAHGLMLEAGLMLAGLYWIVPRYGIVGAAALTATLMILVRGIYTPWLVALYFQSSAIGYLSAIYLRPVLAAIPVAAILVLLKQNLLAGRNWFELIFAGVFTAGAYFTLAVFTCLHEDHRSKLFSLLGRRWKAMLPGGAHA
jgi:O-antigen/teichoic acid export membrane protein